MLYKKIDNPHYTISYKSYVPCYMKKIDNPSYTILYKVYVPHSMKNMIIQII